LADAVGAETNWDAGTKTAAISLGDIEFSFKLTDTFDGVAVRVICGSAYLPAEQLISALGLGEFTIEE
jgi:hypothetical protein